MGRRIKIYDPERTPAVRSELLPATPLEYTVFPGFCDVHVHLREPGFSYKETVKTGTLAAAHGGFTSVCAMPNLSPVPDSAENLKAELSIIERDALISVYPYAAITVGEKGEELSDMDALSENAVAFSDDGRGVQNEALMKKAMERAASLGKIIAAHCEVNSLLKGGYIHDGEWARAHGHRGICSESEGGQIERDLYLAEKTGCAYHVCHISCAESASLIRRAKARGVNVTCETAPHYLLLDEMDLRDEGRFKMNPPLRSQKDKNALLEAILDGTIDMIATDHAPHSDEEKSKGLEKSAFGITGLELCFPLLYTKLVKTGVITLSKLIRLISDAPRERFKIKYEGYTVWSLESEITAERGFFLSKGKATPFENEKLYGECVLTRAGDKTAYKIDDTEVKNNA